ncbi:MAG: inositol monophosphatase [Telmatospirillum sp.]|nr:inositol monophosphatase [Telmatospirillum sp.]
MLADAAIDLVSARIAEIAATAIVPRFQALAAHEIALKGPSDYVTAADLEAEALLEPALVDILPGSIVVGEEAVAKNANVLDRLAEAGPVWIVDPLDGTGNFAQGQRPFCTIVALAVAGKPVAGWIYEPLSGDLLVAVRGQGARFQGRPAALAGGAVGAVYGKQLRKRALASGRFAGFVDERCAGSVYLDLARGRIGFGVFTRALPWDHAAGSLAVAEMGGTSAFMDDRSAYDVRRHVGPLLQASTQSAWDDIASVLADQENAASSAP